MSKADKFKDMMKPKSQESVYDHFMPPAQEETPGQRDNPNVNTSVNNGDSVTVNIAKVPIAGPKKGIKETHTTKAFYIRNDIAELINEDIRNSRRGAMTEIANALFEQYYRSLGRLK